MGPTRLETRTKESTLQASPRMMTFAGEVKACAELSLRAGVTRHAWMLRCSLAGGTRKMVIYA